MTDTKPTSEGTRLDATLEWVAHKVHCVDPCDRVYYEVILASLKELAAIKSQPVPVEHGGDITNPKCPICIAINALNKEKNNG